MQEMQQNIDSRGSLRAKFRRSRGATEPKNFQRKMAVATINPIHQNRSHGRAEAPKLHPAAAALSGFTRGRTVPKP